MNTYQLYVALAASGGGFLNGCTIGAINFIPLLDSFRIYFKLHSWDGTYKDFSGNKITNLNAENNMHGFRDLKELPNNEILEFSISIIFVIGAIIGAIASSFLSEKKGRKKIIIINSAIFLVSSLLMACSSRSLLMFLAGRFIIGFSAGSNGVNCPVYIAEISPTKLRGTLTGCYRTLTIFGMFLSSAICAFIWFFSSYRLIDGSKRNDIYQPIENIEWRFILSIQAVIGFIHICMMSVVPQSPWWLCSIDEDFEAEKNIAKLYSTSTQNPLVQEQLRIIQNNITENRTIGSYTYSELFNPLIRRRTFSTILSQTFQHWNGFISVFYQYKYYNVLNFNKTYSTAVLPNICFFFCFLGTLPGLWLIEKIGRKSLLFFGTALMILFHFIIYFLIHMYSNVTKENEKDLCRGLAFLNIMVFFFIYGLSWYIVPWVYQSEIFPIRVRIKGSAISTTSYLINYLILILLSPILVSLDITRIFPLFLTCYFISILLTIVLMNETKNTGLEDIDNKIANKI